MPAFSVVIPTYNRRERLVRAVRSVIAQRYKDYEIVVVDDGSTDGTLEALRPLSGEVLALRQRNLGPAAARSAGARAARGAYVAFLDSDDVWFPWTLEAFARAAARHPPAAWLYGGGVIDDGSGARLAREAPLVTTCFADYSAAAAVAGLMPFPTGVAISRDILNGTGGFCEKMRVAEDLDLWFRIAHARGFVLVDAPPLYVRELHDGSLGEDATRAYDGMLQLLERERAGTYGMGEEAAFVRRAIITRQLMYYAVSCQVQGKGRLAARLYLEVLRVQARGGFREASFGGRRNRFLLTFPWRVVAPSLHRAIKGVLSRPVPPRAGRLHDRG